MERSPHSFLKKELAEQSIALEYFTALLLFSLAKRLLENQLMQLC